MASPFLLIVSEYYIIIGIYDHCSYCFYHIIIGVRAFKVHFWGFRVWGFFGFSRSILSVTVTDTVMNILAFLGKVSDNYDA